MSVGRALWRLSLNGSFCYVWSWGGMLLSCGVSQNLVLTSALGNTPSSGSRTTLDGRLVTDDSCICSYCYDCNTLVSCFSNLLLQILVSFLQAPASDLGYIPLLMPQPITLSDGKILDHFTPLAGIPSRRPVFSAMLEEDQVVVKLGSTRDIQREVGPSALL
jgi:hypothetical protein